MDKVDVLKAIESALLNRFETAKWAANQAHEAATNEESVAENKYDTFGLEASYLAHGQSQRVVECEKDWLLFQGVEIQKKNENVSLWSLIQLISVDADSPVNKYFFISSCAGGLSVEVGDYPVYVITPSSPVGQMLLGKTEGEEVVLTQNGQQLIYEIELVL